jgi:plasmid stability protein
MITLIATLVGRPMSSITIRKLDPAVKERLRVRAAEHGHSMEAEARDILEKAMDFPDKELTGLDLYKRIRARFAPFGKIELELPSREGSREPPKFD